MTLRLAGTLLAASVLAFAANGCGAEVTTSAAPGESLTPEAVERMADQTIVDIAGDAQQREAKHYLTFRDLNKPYEDCMQAHGVDFHAEYHTLTTGFVPNGTSGTWMGKLNQRPSDLALANVQAAYDDLATSDGDPADDPTAKAQSACEDATGGENQIVYSDAGDDLGAEYTELLDSVEEQLGPIDSYTDCMATAGVDYTTASDGEEGWAGLYLYLTAEMPRPPLAGNQADETWSQYLELQERSLRADAACRGDQYAKGLQILGPELQQFRDSHATELATSAATWEDYVDRAQDAGFVWQGGQPG